MSLLKALSGTEAASTSGNIGTGFSQNSEKKQIGESSDYTPTPFDDYNTVKWYVLRCTYNRGNIVVKELRESGLDCYYPKHHVIKKDGTRKVVMEKPFIPNLVFVNASRYDIDTFLHNRTCEKRYIKYFLNKTKHVEWNGKNPPVTLSDKVMRAFIKICDTELPDIRFVNVESYHLRPPGDHVLVTEGPFKGIEGVYLHTMGNWRVMIRVGNIGFISTTYVAKSKVKVLQRKNE